MKTWVHLLLYIGRSPTKILGRKPVHKQIKKVTGNLGKTWHCLQVII